MKKHHYLICLFTIITLPSNTQSQTSNKTVYHYSYIDFNKNGKMDPYENSSLPTQVRLNNLISLMTLEEKAGQLLTPFGWPMYVRNGDNVELTDKLKSDISQKHIGSLWGFLRADPWTERTLKTGLNPQLAPLAINKLQRYVIENSRLGIPLFLAEEAPHGHMAIGATVFPTSIGLSSTWNPDLIQEMGKAIAKEVRYQGAHIAYGPVLDIAREARWSRVEECFGEDPYLTSQFGVAFVKGLQGTSIRSGENVIATLKHMAGHGVPQGGHNAGAAHMGEYELQEVYLPPFKKAVAAGVWSVMSSYNEVDGIPSSANKYVFTDLLRNNWGFKGFVVSDLFAINGLIQHNVATDLKQAAYKAITAGIDDDLGGSDYYGTIVDLVKSKALPVSVLDQAVRRIVALKFEMGLFDHPFVDEKTTITANEWKEHRALARKVADESIVLLKNENKTLPIRKDIKSIAVIGPNANNAYNMLGDYTAPQADGAVVTVLDGIKNHVSSQTKVNYAKGCGIRDSSEKGFEEAIRIAKESDVIVMVLGGSSARDFKQEYEKTGAAKVSNEEVSDMESGEGYDRATLNLMGKQEKLLQEIYKLGKPVVLVLIKGRPLLINWAAANIPSIIDAWYPGMEGGNAIADVLFGDYNPAGRLSISIPRSVGQLPVYYNAKPYANGSNYIDEVASPLYSFGHGLSYTSFQYSDLSVSPITEKGKTKIIVECSIKNVGSIDGDEVVQLYLRQKGTNRTTPIKRLIAFERTALKAGESKKIKFELSESDLSTYQGNQKWKMESGKYIFMIGKASNNISLEKEIVVKL